MCSENKGADQLRSYCEADLRLCLRIGKNPVFSRRGSSVLEHDTLSFTTFIVRKIRILHECVFIMNKVELAGWPLVLLFVLAERYLHVSSIFRVL